MLPKGLGVRREDSEGDLVAPEQVADHDEAVRIDVVAL